MTKAYAVARYTLLEISRRRLLLLFVIVGALLTVGLGLFPNVVPGFRTNEDKVIFILSVLPGPVALAVELCAFGIGMTVINHDLDSGSIVAILAKPVTRVAYTVGKLGAALAVLIVIGAVFTAGSTFATWIHAGSEASVTFWFFAASVANFLLLAVLVMVLTVYLNNIIAAGIVVAFSFVQNNVSSLHAMVQSKVITNQLADAAINFFYWVVPHPLASNLQRETATLDFVQHPPPPEAHRTLADILASIPSASGSGEIIYWLAYLAVLCVILYVAVRRKQV